MGFLFYASMMLFLLISVVLCFSILIQESKSLGLGASFGGDAGDSLFGTSTADVLKKFTAWVSVCFLAACILLSTWSEAGSSGQIQQLPTSIEEVEEG
jgi:preprotein translocase subunit SecG